MPKRGRQGRQNTAPTKGKQRQGVEGGERKPHSTAPHTSTKDTSDGKRRKERWMQDHQAVKQPLVSKEGEPTGMGTAAEGPQNNEQARKDKRQCSKRESCKQSLPRWCMLPSPDFIPRLHSSGLRCSALTIPCSSFASPFIRGPGDAVRYGRDGSRYTAASARREHGKDDTRSCGTGRGGRGGRVHG